MDIRLFRCFAHALVVIGLWGTLANSLTWADEVSVADLGKAISSSDLPARYKAIDALAARGPAAAEAVSALTTALKDKDERTRWRAARALGAIGPQAKASAAGLVGLLKDPTPVVRGNAAHALGQIGNVAPEVVPALTRTLADPESNVRRAAVRALDRIRPGSEVMLPLLSKLLEDDDPSVVMHALQSLADVGDRALPLIIKALDNDKSRYWACLVLADMGPAAKDAVPSLTRALTDEDPELRMQALIALGEIGPPAAKAEPEIAKALTDEQPSVRYGAAFALGKIGAKNANAALEKTLTSEDEFLAMISAWALAQINPQDAQATGRAVKVLVDAITHQNAMMRNGAVRGLTELKSGRPEAIGALVQALGDEDPEVMANSLAGLVALGSASVPQLSKALTDSKRRTAAAVALEQIGDDAKAAAPALAASLKQDDAEYRREAHFALAALGPAAAEAVPELIKALAAQEPEVRYSACYALGKIGPAAKPAVSALKTNVQSQDEFLRLASIWALLAIEPKEAGMAEMAIPLLADALDDERPLVRREAASALGSLGPRAKETLPALKRALQGETDPAVRDATEKAIQKITG